MKAQELLFQLQDKGYRDFQSKLIPTIPAETIIGVRIPTIRKLAKEYGKDPESVEFLKQLPHTYYDENILHALLVAEIKDYEVCVKEVERFLPYVDNWAVCDIFSPRVFRKNRDRLIDKIKEWAASEHPYTCRFGMEMLMTHFLDEDFRCGIFGNPGSGTFRGILCEHDDRVVLCHGTGKTVGCRRWLYREKMLGSMDS